MSSADAGDHSGPDDFISVLNKLDDASPVHCLMFRSQEIRFRPAPHLPFILLCTISPLKMCPKYANFFILTVCRASFY